MILTLYLLSIILLLHSVCLLKTISPSTSIQSYVCISILRIGIQKNPKKKYSKKMRDKNSSQLSHHSRSTKSHAKINDLFFTYLLMLQIEHSFPSVKFTLWLKQYKGSFQDWSQIHQVLWGSHELNHTMMRKDLWLFLCILNALTNSILRRHWIMWSRKKYKKITHPTPHQESIAILDFFLFFFLGLTSSGILFSSSSLFSTGLYSSSLSLENSWIISIVTLPLTCLSDCARFVILLFTTCSYELISKIN